MPWNMTRIVQCFLDVDGVTCATSHDIVTFYTKEGKSNANLVKKFSVWRIFSCEENADSDWSEAPCIYEWKNLLRS